MNNMKGKNFKNKSLLEKQEHKFKYVLDFWLIIKNVGEKPIILSILLNETIFLL